MQQRDLPNDTPDPYSSANSNAPLQSQPMPQPAQGPIPALRRRHPLLSHTAVAIVALGIGTGIGSAGHSSGTTAAQTSTAATYQASASVSHTAAAATTASSEPAPAKTIAAPATRASSAPTTVSGDGEYFVGTDMKPGTYRTAGPADPIGMCYWERDKNASGDFDAIIANDNLTGTGMVTVKQGDYFKSTGCQDWVRVG